MRTAAEASVGVGVTRSSRKGKFSEDGQRITGCWEIAEDGKTWKTDFDLILTKVE